MRQLGAFITASLLAALGSALAADVPARLSTDEAIAHALNRLTFGPRPQDVARVKREGLAAWTERQLNPSRIDDSGMTDRLARLSTLGLDSATLIREIHQPARRERQQLLRDSSATNAERTEEDMPNGGAADPSTAAAGPPAAPRRPMNATIRRDQQIITDLSEAKILRAVYSERQLEEVLVDFWFNHFNVFAGKGATRVWLGEFERDAIRPNVLGNFRTLLESVAKSPAMLIYLDNWMNVEAKAGTRQPASGIRNPASGQRQPGSQIRRAGGVSPGVQGAVARRATGLNENYARELMELHTLGVDGGYTQQDVVNVARAFTGWTLDLPRNAGRGRASGIGFRFDPRLHDDDPKTVLGYTIKSGGGVRDGEQVLDILAAHPATARFIAEKLARRFVSDDPPAALVERVAAKFLATRGDLKETVRLIITSPEFFAPAAYRAKVKTPLEFVVSALRTTGAEVSSALSVARELRELGMPLYLCQPPTGYDDTAATWVSSGALVSRMNFALAMGRSRLRGVTLPFAASSPVESVRVTLLSDALAGSASKSTIETIEKAATVEQTIALALGSPEFQHK